MYKRQALKCSEIPVRNAIGYWGCVFAIMEFVFDIFFCNWLLQWVNMVACRSVLRGKYGVYSKEIVNGLVVPGVFKFGAVWVAVDRLECITCLLYTSRCV